METMFIGPSLWSLWYQRLHQHWQAEGGTGEPCLALLPNPSISASFRRQMKQCLSLASPPSSGRKLTLRLSHQREM